MYKLYIMPKEILLYFSIYSYSVADIITQMEAAKDSDLVLRVNTPGGEVYYAYGLIAKYAEHPKSKKVKVDGRADSCGAFLCCYASDVECLDVSTFTFHRAAFPEYIENNPQYFTEDMKSSLALMNDQLRAAMEGKMKEEDFIKVTGVSYDELFSLDSRIEVILDAKQAKKLGLVNKIVTITPEKKAAIEAMSMQIAAQTYGIKAISKETNENQSQKKVAMTIEQLKAEHPDTYAAAVKVGVDQEKDRAGAFLAFIAVDPEAVAKGIKDGNSLSQTQMAEFAVKAMSSSKLAAIASDSPAAVTTVEAEAQKTAARQEIDAEWGQFDKNLGIKKA